MRRNPAGVVGLNAVGIFAIEEMIGVAGPELGGFGFFVTVGIGFLGLGSETGFLEFFEVDHLAGEAREDVKETGVFERVFSEFLFYGGG